MNNENQISARLRMPLLAAVAIGTLWLLAAPCVQAQAAWHIWGGGWVPTSKSTGGNANAFAVSTANGTPFFKAIGSASAQATGSMVTRLYPSAANGAQQANTSCNLGVGYETTWEMPDGSAGGYPVKGLTVTESYIWGASAMAYTGANMSGSGNVSITNIGAPGNGLNTVGCPAGGGLSSDVTAQQPNDPVKAGAAAGSPSPSSNYSVNGKTSSEFGGAIHTKNVFLGTAVQFYSVDMAVGISIRTIHCSADGYNRYGNGIPNWSPNTTATTISSLASPPSAGNGTAAADGDFQGSLGVSVQSD